jgi:hypothetical protein
VFISYASPDRARVTPYFDRLASRGFGVWMDYKSIKAGQNWDFEIRRALDKASIIVVFISNHSVDRRGYLQREIKLALKKAEEKLTGDIYIIPVLLDLDVTIPDLLREIHCVKAWEADCHASIEDAVNHQLRTLGAEIQAAQDRANLRWSQTEYKESWEGLPGYEAEFNLLQFSSTEYPHIGDITVFVHGQLMALIMEERRVKFQQIPDFFSFGQSKPYRMNTFDAHCSEPIISGKIISVPYNVHWYGAGAAHANMYFLTYAFFLDPVVHIPSLKHIFRDDTALGIIQSEVRQQLLAHSSTQEELPSRDREWVEKGTEHWENFRAFVFKEKELELFFAPYQVDCFAAGPQSATIKYDRIAALMLKEYVYSLGIGHLC